MRKTALMFFITLGLCLTARAALPFEQLLYKGRAVPFYGEASSPDQQKYIDILRGSHLAERQAYLVNSSLHLKSDIGVGFESCGQVNALFDRQKHSIIICYEFVDMVVKTAYDDKDGLMKLPKEQFSKVIDGLMWGVFLHELGHALIHTNNVPVTGREEDVADQFSVWFAVNFLDLNKTPVISPKIWLWSRLAQARNIPTMTEDERRRFMSNEHSLDEQRIYNLACWALGTGSEGGAKTAAYARLPEERAQRCPAEYAQVDFAMKSLFKKYFKVKPLRGSW